MSKHTPGSWRAMRCTLNPINPLTIVSEHGVAVASVEAGHLANGDNYEGREGEFTANARLIAAAPDMHAWMACEEARAHGSEDVAETALMRFGWRGRQSGETAQQFMDRKRRAILAKAEGLS